MSDRSAPPMPSSPTPAPVVAPTRSAIASRLRSAIAHPCAPESPWQQAWARSIELLDARLNLSLKDGLGPEALLSYVVPIAYALEVTYRGDRLNPATDAELEALRAEAERWMRERGKDT